MGKFTKQFDDLEDAVDFVATKKVAHEHAQHAAEKASEDYQDAIAKAEALQADLQRRMSDLLPSVTSGRVRTS